MLYFYVASILFFLEGENVSTGDLSVLLTGICVRCKCTQSACRKILYVICIQDYMGMGFRKCMLEDRIYSGKVYVVNMI